MATEPTATDTKTATDTVWWRASAGTVAGCRWCGVHIAECPDPVGHDRFDRASESTWRGVAA